MSVPVDARDVALRVEELQQRLRALSPDRKVGIVAVTKGFGVEAPRAALSSGLTMLGENYAQELVAKNDALTSDERNRVEWHFLGRLQRNKVRALAAIVSVWQSVDRLELLEEIAKRAPGARVMVQLDLSEEPQKGGASFADGAMLVDRARELGLGVVGLMGVGAAGDPGRSAAGFARLVGLADQLDLPERSIGMTDDLELAVAEGSTMVRVGSGLFGPRPAREIS